MKAATKSTSAYFLRKQVQDSLSSVLNELISTEEFWEAVDKTLCEEMSLAEAWLVFYGEEPKVSISDKNIQWCEHLDILIQIEDYTDNGGPYEGEQAEELRRSLMNIEKLMASLNDAKSQIERALEKVKP